MVGKKELCKVNYRCASAVVETITKNLKVHGLRLDHCSNELNLSKLILKRLNTIPIKNGFCEDNH
jgi:hypothetical protein